MPEQSFQDILGLIQTPTRYTGNEVNTSVKDPDRVDLSFALVFPDLYEIGTSHFGIQILYSILNREPEIAAERFFAPAPDLEAHLRHRGIPCLSLESQTPLNQFDIIGVSLLYELNFTNILNMFSLSGIPFYSGEREDTFPLVIGGGPCAFNPEPLADFFDLFLIGDGEEAVRDIAHTVIRFQKDGDGQKKTLLTLLSRIQGVYVPGFYTRSRNEAGFPVLIPGTDAPPRIRRAILPELTRDQFPSAPIVPFGKPVHDRLRLEIARGCSRGCRFCQAGMIYRPVRERSLTDLVDLARESLAATGYEDISLLSLSAGDYSCLPELMQHLLTLDRHTGISLPSIRAERLTPELMTLIRSVRKTGFTIAPEAGTQRLRDIINKNLTEADIIQTVTHAFELGWQTIKLYFMMGLPFETPEDLAGICDLSTRLASTCAKGKRSLTVSVTTFIPKAHTPFQRHPQLTLSETREKLNFLTGTLRHPKIRLKWQDPRMSLLEGVFARGDRDLSRVLVAAHDAGCRLDGWSDHFDFSRWEAVFDRTGTDPAFYTSRTRTPEEPLPWDIIDTGIQASFLAKEWENAEQGIQTPDCRDGTCTGCGICDFRTIRPVPAPESAVSVAPRLPDIRPDEDFVRFDLWFSKREAARFFGHLELAAIFQRAIRRAGLPVKYSKGFNPAMRLSFDTALPVGMESESETCHVFLDKTLSPDAVATALNRQLPSGLTLIRCCRSQTSGPVQADPSCRYRVTLPLPCVSPADVSLFMEQDTWVVTDRSKKGTLRHTDLRRAVTAMTLTSDTLLEMVMQPYEGREIRPAAVLKTCFDLTDDLIARVRILKCFQG